MQHNFSVRNTTLALWGIWLAYLALIATGLIHHEMWRDEYNVYNIIKNAPNLAAIQEHIRYEGHPIVWFVEVWLFHQLLPIGPDILKITTFFNVAVGSAILLRYSPFSLLEKCLILSGYFFLFEYSVIARGYSLYVMYLPLWCAVFDRYRTTLSMATLMTLIAVGGLLAYVALMSAALLIPFCVVLLLLPSHRMRHFIACSAIGALYLSMVYGIYPPSDFMHYNGELHYDMLSFAVALISIFNSFVPITNVMGLLALVLLCQMLRKYPKIVIVYGIGIVVLSILIFYTQIYSVRFTGLAWLLLIALMWMYHHSIDWNHHSRYKFLALLLCNALCGGFIWAMDFSKPFSSSTATIPLLQEHYLGNYIFVSYPDYVGPVFIAYSKQHDAQLLGNENFGDYVRWNRARILRAQQYLASPEPLIHHDITQLSKEASTRCTSALVVSAKPLDLASFHHLKHVVDFDEPTYTHENYSVYEVEGIPPKGCLKP